MCKDRQNVFHWKIIPKEFTAGFLNNAKATWGCLYTAALSRSNPEIQQG
jgi:hypothetical protein